MKEHRTSNQKRAWLAIGWGEGTADMRIVSDAREMVQWLWEQCGPDHTGSEESTRNYWYAYLEDFDNWTHMDGLQCWHCSINVGETGHIEFQALHGDALRLAAEPSEVRHGPCPCCGTEWTPNVAPIARVEIIGGEVSQTEIYAPGLPDGAHDLFPVPLERAPEPSSVLICDNCTFPWTPNPHQCPACGHPATKASEPPSDRHRLELRLAFDKWMATRDPQALSEIAMLINAVCGATVTKSALCAIRGCDNEAPFGGVCGAHETSATNSSTNAPSGANRDVSTGIEP